MRSITSSTPPRTSGSANKSASIARPPAGEYLPGRSNIAGRGLHLVARHKNVPHRKSPTFVRKQDFL